VSATLERARQAVALAFVANGVAFASWVSRTPAVRDTLGLTSTQLGLLLLCGAVGSLVALPLSGALVHRFGPARTVSGGGATVAAGFFLAAIGLNLTTVPATAVGLLMVGLGISVWDVAMNVEGADVENQLGRPLMPRFHAGFSVGSVLGALIGAGAAAVGIDVATQLLMTAALVLGAVALAVRAFLVVQTKDESNAGSMVAMAWREPRTLLIGVFVLAFAFSEGSANDWMALAVVDGLGASDALGALGFGVFVAAMTVGRTFGGSALQRYGRVPVLRTSAAVTFVGLLLVVFGPGLGSVMAGAVLWGLGTALGFPVGMSAAADDPRLAAVRVSVVSSIGYTAFLAGPPLIGLLADNIGIRRGLLVVVVALAAALLTVGRTRKLEPVAVGD
jgi:MFS family permease